MRALVTLILTVTLFSGLNSQAKSQTPRKTAAYKNIPFLSFDQLAQLEHSQRVAYVLTLREAAMDVERAQFSFRNSERFAQYIEGLKNERSLFASLLFGIDAFAQATTGCRGRSITDRCIYAFNVSSYPETSSQAEDCTGTRQPFQCRFDQFKCTGNNGAGVKCDSFLSGMGSYPNDACIPEEMKFSATKLCVAAQEDLSKRNDGTIQRLLAKTKTFYGLNGPPKTLTRADMMAGEAEGLLKQLSQHAYDPDVYAHLIYIVNLYKRNGLDLPFKDKDRATLYKNIDPKKFDASVADFQGALNEIFQDYYNHCMSEIPEDELRTLINLKPTDVQHLGTSLQAREMKRREAALRARSGTAGRRVIDITESVECQAILGEIEEIRGKIVAIGNTCPQIDGVPCGPPTTNPPPPGLPTDETPVVDDGVNPIGCGSARDADPDELYQPAARCMPCLASKAIVNAGIAEHSAPSTKWISLLSTMAVACGEGVEYGQKVNLQTMLKYMQTFGTCENETYRWSFPPGSELDQTKRSLIKEWSQKNFWEQKKWYKKVAPDQQDDFAKVYGISYEMSQKVFCGQTRDGFGSLLREDAALTINPNKDPKIEIKPNTGRHSVADGLKQCMHEAYKNATKLYSGSTGQSCMKVVNSNSLKFDNEPFEGMKSHVTEKNGALVAFTNDLCYESVAVQTDKSTGRRAIAFNDAPSPKNPAAIKRRFNTKVMPIAPPTGRPQGYESPTLTCYPSLKDSGDPEICAGGIDFTITAPDPSCGVTASKTNPTSKRSTK